VGLRIFDPACYRQFISPKRNKINLGGLTLCVFWGLFIVRDLCSFLCAIVRSVSKLLNALLSLSRMGLVGICVCFLKRGIGGKLK